MQNRETVEELLTVLPLDKSIQVLGILKPFLTDNGKAWTTILESEFPSSRSRSMATQPPSGRFSSASTNSSIRSKMSSQRSSSRMGYSDDTSSIEESVHSMSIPEHDTASYPTPLTPAPMSHQKRSLGYRAVAAPHRVSKATQKLNGSAALSPMSPKKPLFECPFCLELNMNSSTLRKADLKRHFKSFHHTDAQWLCPVRSCGMSFDWQKALDHHLKDVHGDTQHSSEEAKVKLCPQVVFGCGFINCKLVLEASSEDDADKKATEYFNHVINHFEDNLSNREWSHSARIRNLMRQKAVEGHWKDRKKRVAGPQDLEWQSHTSTVLRKLLETRHFSDVESLITWAVRLGSKPYCEPKGPLAKLPLGLRLPLKEHCTSTSSSHRPVHHLDSHLYLQDDAAGVGSGRVDGLPAPPHDHAYSARAASYGLQESFAYQPYGAGAYGESANGALVAQNAISGSDSMPALLPPQSVVWVGGGGSLSDEYSPTFSMQPQFDSVAGYASGNDGLLSPAYPHMSAAAAPAGYMTSPQLSAVGSKELDMDDYHNDHDLDGDCYESM